MNTKICTAECGQKKPLSQFPKRKSSKDGYRGTCKSCMNIRSKKSYQKHKDTILVKHAEWKVNNQDRIKERSKEYYKENKEYIAAKNAEWYEENKEARAAYCLENKEVIRARRGDYYQKNKEKLGAYAAAYRQENKESMDAYQVVYRQENKESAAAYNARWCKANSDKCAAKKAKRRAKKLNQTPPDADFKLIEEFYKEARHLTETTGVSHHVDHIKPLDLGGLHHQDNLQVLTAEENLRKGNKY